VGPSKNELITKSGKKLQIPHWFDGVGMGHCFLVSEGQVRYQTCNLNPRYEQHLQDHEGPDGMILVSALDPCQSIFRRLVNIFRPVGPISREAKNANVTITPDFPSVPRDEGGTSYTLGLVVKTDANILMEMDEEAFQPKRVFDYTDVNPKLKGPLAVAHENYDALTGEYFNVVIDIGSRTTYRFFVLTKDNPKGKILAEINAPAAYIHSFGMTENYLIFVLQPSFYSMNGLGLKARRGLLEALSFDGEKPTRVYVIDRRGGRGVVKTFELPAFYFFHTVNSWEEQDDETAEGRNRVVRNVYMRMPCYPNDDVFRKFYIYGRGHCHASPDLPSTISRLKVLVLRDVENSASTTASLEDDRFPEAIEMPNINYARHGYGDVRAVYGLSFADGKAEVWSSSIIKVDYAQGKVLEWRGDPGCYPTEPMFIADPRGEAEDDGIVLSAILDHGGNRGFLLVLDARTLKEFGRASYDGRIPIGLHGAWKGRT